MRSYKNLIIVIVSGLLLFSGGLLYKANRVRKNTDILVYKMNSVQNRINDKHVELSKKSYRFSDNESQHQETDKTIKFLEKVFGSITNTAGDNYNKTFLYVSKSISDKRFVNDELTSLKNLVESTGLMMENVSVDITSKGSAGIFTVVVTYIPYYAKSDLYQKEKLKKEVLVYSVTCVGRKISKVAQSSAKITN